VERQRISRQESGRHFDPGVVEAFFQIFDVIKAIDRKIQE
jgi:response regulator RpfG family c-di-GMP phosphodiesterase